MESVKKKVDFTEGKVFLKIVWFILPIMATNLLQTFYNAADMMVVSLSHEANAVGAIGTTGSFINLVVNVFIGFSVGANVVVAREIGAKDREKTQKAVHTALLMAVMFGVLGMAIGVSISRLVLRSMGNSGNLLDLAVRYTYIYFLGVPFLALTNYLMAIFRAKGDAKTPLAVLTLTGLLNVGMNFIFVVVVGLSVEGVALATSMANVASVIVLLTKLSKEQDDTTFSWKNLKIDKTSFQDIVVNGLPAGIQGALFSLSNILIQSSVVTVNNKLVPPNSNYDAIINGNAAALNLEGFVYMAMSAVYQGAITFTSQNMGAKKPCRVKRIMYSCAGIVSAIGLVMSVIMFLLRTPLLSLYGIVPGEEGSLQRLAFHAAEMRFIYICLFYFLCGLMDVMTGVLRGLGKSMIATILALVGACLLRVVWIWTVFAASQTLEAIYISYPISWVVTTVAGFTTIQLLLKKILRNQNCNTQTKEENTTEEIKEIENDFIEIN
ncbi:MAG: MATE family efflux transporter [Clostridiales bacterium]|nr:MATE family efflux transporter [Clostridiales bacterium]